MLSLTYSILSSASHADIKSWKLICGVEIGIHTSLLTTVDLAAGMRSNMRKCNSDAAFELDNDNPESFPNLAVM